MAFEVVMPRLGWNMEEGALAGWRKNDGETVTAGEVLFEVESDKAIQEVEALESGILRIPPGSPPQGKQVPVGTLLAYLVKPGEPMPAGSPAAAAAPAGLETAGPSRPAAAAEGPPAAPAPSPASSRAASAVPSQGPSRGAEKRPAISPRARRVAGELGVEWGSLAGSGRTGRIVERDVRKAAPTPRRGDASSMTSVRRQVAERMSVSARTTAAVTLTTEADATELVRLRTMFEKEGAPVVPAYNDMLILVSALALMEHPECNVSLSGDSLLAAGTANVGLAVDTDRGLMVPVVRDAQKLSLRKIAETTALLVEEARTGRIRAEDLRGGTFTITNLGMYEIDAFTPIINRPECAILGAGRIVAKQVVTDAEAGTVAIRHMMFLSLTFDHRLVDGVSAARLLQAVKRYVEMPYLWLAGQG